MIDYRGEYDKNKKDYVYGEPVERIWGLSNSTATDLMNIQKRKGKPLTKMVFDVTRVGADKDTKYTFESAREDPADDESPIVKPITDWEEQLDPLEDILKPLPRATLELVLGNEDYEEEGNAEIQ